MKLLSSLLPVKWLCLPLAILLFCLPLHADPTSNPAVGTIIPGESAGKLKLGMTLQQMTDILGEPIEVRKYKRDEEYAHWPFYPEAGDEEDGIAVYYKDNKSYYIEVNASKFIAPHNITTRSLLSQVIAYNHNLKVSAFKITGSSFELYYYDDISDGITYGVWTRSHYDHSHIINVIGIHRPGTPTPTPIDGTKIEPTLNKPSKPKRIPTGPDSPFSKDGLPLTEHVTPEGARGYTTKPIIMHNSVSFLGTALTSYQGKHVSATVILTFVSYSQTPRWLGETHVTFTFAGRRLELQGVKSTEQTKNGLIVEELDVKVPVKDFLEIAKGSNLYFEIGGSRFMIDKRYLAGLRALRAKVASK